MSSGTLPSVGAVPRHDSDNASDLSLGCLSTQAGQRRCDRGRPHVERGGVKVVSKAPGAITRRASGGIGFMLFLQELLYTGGRARTDTVLSHHRILSPARLPIPPLRRAEPRHYNNVQSSLDIGGEYARGGVLWYRRGSSHGRRVRSLSRCAKHTRETWATSILRKCM
jgi:hypothetical protein